MFGNSLMNAVLTIRPDTAQLKRDLDREVPAAVKSSTKRAEREAETGFRRVGKAGGDALSAELRKGQAAGLSLDKNGKWRNAKGDYASAGELLGAGLTDGLNRAVDRGMGATLTSMSTKLSNAGGKLMKGGAVMTAGLTVPLAMFAKSSAETAIQFEDAVAANEQWYGAGSKALDKWTKDHATAFNTSIANVQNYASAMGSALQVIPDETERAQAFLKVLERVADVRSMKGGNVSEMMSAWQRAYMGEFDPLETQLGVSIRQADIAKKASEMGLLEVNTAKLAKAQENVNKLEADGKKGSADHQLALQALDEVAKGATDTMSQQSRVLAVNALLMDRTSKAAGDIARTQDSSANKIEAAKAAWDDLKLTLGQELLPVVGDVAPKLTDMVKRLSDSGAFDRLVPAIERAANALVGLLDGFTRLPSWVQTASLAVAAFGGPLAGVTGGVLKLSASLVEAIAKLTAYAAASRAAAASEALGAGGAGGAARGAAMGGLGRAGAVGAVAAGSLATGWGIGKVLMGGTDWLREKIRGDRFPTYDVGGVHNGPGRIGDHSLALVARGETMVPTHKYPVDEALRRVGLPSGGGADSATVAALAAAASAPRTVTVVAPPGMDTRELAAEIDRIQRGSATRRLRPAATRRAV